MAEEGSVYELEGLQTQLESLLGRYSRDGLQTDSKTFCSDFCKLVEEYASRWQVPLPQLRILETALSYFARASTFFTSNCDHVLHTLSSLALSVFELLLFFDQKDFNQEPLKRFTVTFQECHSTLARHQNVHLLQVECLVQGGGPWASPVLQQILSESNLPQNEVDGCISSELPVFFELRVRYLLSCERLSEAIALAKCCARHPTAGQHLFFLQVYLTWLYKSSQRDRLHKEVNDLNGKDAVHIICSLEGEENNDLLLGLSRSFLFQQLRKGDMCYLCDLVFIWSKLHNRLKTSKQALLEESHQLMLSATNVNSIFPFIRAILQELGEDGIQFCVELCANALESCLPCDVITKSLIYKTIAGLLPNDLEVCRACALLVFFVERTVESYKMVYLLYMHPDQEYHVEYSPIANHIRFEMLQVLKKDLYFDPEFWNLIALRTNCLKLMSEKHVSAALEEIMEDKWIHNYCTKEPAFHSITSCQRGNKGAAGKKRHHKDNTDAASKRLKAGSGRTRLNSDNAVKKKGSRSLKEAGSQPLRRSYWQLDRIQDNVASRYGEYRRTTRLSEKNPPKRRIRKPKWLLEDSGNHEENGKMRKHGLRHQKHHRSTVVKRSEPGQIKNSSKQKLSVNSHLKTKENSNKQQGGFSMDSSNKQTPQVVLELSLPDNELMGTFTDDTSNRQRGIPQVLLYKPTVKLPSTSTSTSTSMSTSTSQPLKAVHRKEVVLRARDTAMFIQQLHCYYRRQKGKGNAANVQGSVSTITRSSVQGSPTKDSPRESCDKSEVKGSSEASKATEVEASPFSRKTEKSAAVLQTSPAAETAVKVTKSQVCQPSSKGKLLQSITSTREKCPAETKTSNAASTQNCEEPAVEMKVTIASPTPAAAKISQSQNLDKVSKAQRVDDLSKTSTAECSPTTTTTAENNQKTVTNEISNNSNAGAEERKLKLLSSRAETDKIPEAHAKTETPEALVCKNMAEGNVAEETSVRGNSAAEQGGLNDVSALTLVTEMVTELDKQKAPENVSSKESTAGSKTKVPQKTRTTSSCSPAWEASAAAAAADKDLELQKDKEETQDNCSDSPEEPETEESKLEFCCTFCNKVFKGSRVVAHAMFHYRKDECMFCGVMFKDDLLAMMHLSDHIEKLKRIKESTVNKAQENQVSETKDVSTTKTSSAKAKTTDPSPGRRSSGRTKASAGCPSKSRKLRSDDKPTDRQVFKERKQNASKHLNNKTPVHKLNGHVGKKKKLDTTRKDMKTKQGTSQERRNNGSKDAEMDSSSSSVQTQKEFVCSSEDKMKETESLQVLKTATKQNGKTVEEKNMEPEEKVRCPVDGCVWFTDLSKNRVALLYHALDDHYGEIKPLELAFRIGHSKCSICMRVLWSFEHFKHHVERHRLAPRHPCLHQGCDARFKTGMEMRRHARRHSPLQAVCCLPGCSRLFICLWALNLHEREHYASKQTKTDKITTEQRGDKHNNATVSKKQDHKPKDATTANAVNKTVSVKAARKLKRQTHNLSSRKHTSSSVRASEPKEKNETKDSNVLKNLSNKDTTAQPTLPNLRLRQTLRKGQATNTKLPVSRSNRVIASLLKHNSKVRYKLKKKQVLVKVKGPARRGRPPKTKKVVHDENTSAESVKDKTSVQNDVKTPTKAAETSTEAHERKDQEVLDESKCKKLVKKNHVKQTVNSLKQSENSTSAETTTKKLTNTDKIKKVHKVKKRLSPKESSGKTTATDVSKSKKLKVNTKTEKKKCVKEETESEKTELKQTEETAAAEKVESSVDKDKEAENSVPAALEKNEAAAPPTTSAKKTQKVTTEEESVITKKEKHKDTKTKAAPSGSGKAETKHKDVNKKGDKKKVKDKQPCKDLLKTSASKKTKTDSVIQQQDETKTAATSVQSGQKEEEEAAAVTPENSSAPIEENKKVTTEKKSKKCNEKKKSEPNKVRKKRKNQDGDVKIAKKKCKDEGAEDTKPKPEAEPLAEEKVEVKERSAGEEANTTTEMPQSTPGHPGYSLINGQAASEDAKGSTCRETLSQYSKKPYMRPPPTAYLDEKYITMPKRRKELSLFQSSPRNPPPGQTSAAAATVATTTQQRQRCANCFATFNSGEDLQSHLQLQKCSNLFGFDSDDEGNS